MKIYTYKVIKGEFKDRTVKSFESNALMHPNMPMSAFDDEGNEYVFTAHHLYLTGCIDQKAPDYKTAKEFGFEGSYEDYLESLKHFI